VLTTQVYLYYIFFPLDSRTLKCLAYGVFIFESIQTGLTTAAAFDQYVYSDGNVARVDTFPYVWFSVPIMAAITAAVVQIFFAWRIKILDRSSSYILPVTVVMLALMQLGAGTAGGVKMHQAGIAADLGPADASLIAWLVGAALNDVVIAVAMTYLLLKARTGVAKTDAVISSIIRLTVETGTITAALAIVDIALVTAPSLRTTLLYQGPAPVITKLYANTLLVNLNNRAFVRKNLEEVIESIHLPQMNTISGRITQETAIDHSDSAGRAFSGSLGTKERVIHESAAESMVSAA